MIPEAIIFPANPEGLTFDFGPQIAQAAQAGARLYTNGERLGLFKNTPPRGWFPMAMIDKNAAPEVPPPCAA